MSTVKLDFAKESANRIKLLIKQNNSYVLFSGGRDSLVTMHLVNDVAKKMHKMISVVHVDTTVSTPGILEYVQKTCYQLGVELIVVRPKIDFFTLTRKWGFPTVTRRWCCYHLKIEPLKELLLDCPDPKVVFDGIRREESPKRATYPISGIHKHFKCLCYHAIFEWTSEQVHSYIAEHGLKENPLYAKGFHRAAECWCTSYKSVKQFLMLKQQFPELFQKFVDNEKCLKTGGSALFRNGKRIYLRDL